MKRKMHLFAAILATLCIATFFTSTIIVELFSSRETILTVKASIVAPGLYILMPAMMVVGSTGFSMPKNTTGRLINSKKKRMRFIAVNGLFILAPCAIFLSLLAASGSFGTKFFIVQIIELLAGATNLILMGLNARDGLKMTGKLSHNSLT